MREAAITSFVIFFLVFITTFVAGQGSSEAVMDYRGRPVKPNIPYFIQPAGDLDLWISHSRRFMEIQCPQVAVLSRTSLVAVVFLQQSEADYVSLATNISIRFEGYNDVCPESGIWRVDQDSPFPKPDISASGSVFAPNSTFQIKKGNEVYKFVYESVNVGVYTDPTTRIKHLVLNRIPLSVIFEAVNEEGDKTFTF